jgi:hypothetical protein
MKEAFFTYSLILVFSLQLPAQGSQSVNISGTICQKKNRKPLQHARLVSYMEMITYTTDSEGKFQLYLHKNDSLKIVSMGYEAIVVKVKDFLSREGSDTIFLNPASYLLNEVTVRAKDQSINLHLPGNIGKNINPDAQPDRSIPSPSVGMILTPLTLAHSVFSRKAKNQRKLQETIKIDKKMSVWYNILSTDLLKEWTLFDEKELDDFIIFCNQHIIISHKDNVLTIHKKVMQILDIYRDKTE